MQTENLISTPGNTLPGELKLDLLNVKKTAFILRAINHKLRQVMLNLIAENENISVSEIYSKLLLEQSVASQHLAILRKAGFVKTRRNGKYIYYSVNKERINELNSFVSQFVG